MTDINESLFRSLAEVRVIGILRGCPPEHVVFVAGAATDAGLAVLEVTLDSPGALQSIELLGKTFPGLVIGAGTVRTVEEVAEAVRAGASFIVSPVVDEQVISACDQYSIPVLPGAATPTEVSRALRAGAGAVKLFPAAQLGGPGYVAAIRGPLGNPRLVPTGGVSIENGRAFLDAGAAALGVGGSVFAPDALARGDAGEVRSRATAFVRSIT